MLPPSASFSPSVEKISAFGGILAIVNVSVRALPSMSLSVISYTPHAENVISSASSILYAFPSLRTVIELTSPLSTSTVTGEYSSAPLLISISGAVLSITTVTIV